MSTGYAAVVGAVNMDICGTPYTRVIAKDSNPGTVRHNPGGVGRNIAHNLRLLGVQQNQGIPPALFYIIMCNIHPVRPPIRQGCIQYIRNRPVCPTRRI